MSEIHVAEVTRETDRAILCRVAGEEVWIPKSEISDESEVQELGDSGVLVIPKWLAEAKGLEE